MRKILAFLFITMFTFVLASCSVTRPNAPTEKPSNVINSTTKPSDDGELNEFTVTIKFNDKVVKPVGTVYAVWQDDNNTYREKLVDGKASVTGLDGEYHIHLVGEIKDATREIYTYNPNIYTADNNNRDVTIKLMLITRNSGGLGTLLYNPYVVEKVGTYRTPVFNDVVIPSDSGDTQYKKGQVFFYMFQPTKSGVYEIETICDIYLDEYNPIIYVYQGSIAWKKMYQTLNDGGSQVSGGYTKNVKWSVRISQNMIGNVFTFALTLDSKLKTYDANATIDFSISYTSDYLVFEDEPIMVRAENNLFNTPNYNVLQARLYNANVDDLGKTSRVFDGNLFKYDPDYLIDDSQVKGVWRRYDPKTNTFKEPLVAYITAPCKYINLAFSSMINMPGNPLLVSNATEDYTLFITQDYAPACNKDGVCYVTNEIKEFLQKYSIRQLLFADGNGWCEDPGGVYAAENDQWLFACAYYVLF